MGIKGKFSKKTKYFGDLEFYVEYDHVGDDWVSIHTSLNDQRVFIHIPNYNNLGKNHNLCWEIIDKYLEINEIAKKIIVNKFAEKNGKANYYFKEFFEERIKLSDREKIINVFGINDLEMFDIDEFIKKINYPDLCFYVEKSIMTISIEYTILENYPQEDVIICVLMNEKLEVTGFEIEYE